MSEYLRAYIPTCEAFGWSGGDGFNTRIVSLRDSGREARNAKWMQPQHFFSLPFQNISQPQYAPIKQMHLNRRGRWGVFLYHDRSDPSAVDEIFAVATAGQTEFQLSKWSVIEGVSYRREVYALYRPNSDGSAEEVIPTVTVDDAPFTSFVTDPDRGVLVADAPMAGGEILKWSGLFSLWVRFDNDRLPFSIDSKSNGRFVMNGTVELLEMPPPEEEVSGA
jgi:uncharacterized protein (TIGR02217 family)